MNNKKNKKKQNTQTVESSSPVLLNKHSLETKPSARQSRNDLLVELKTLWCEIIQVRKTKPKKKNSSFCA